MPYKDSKKYVKYQKQYWKLYSQNNRPQLNNKENLRRKRIKKWLKNYTEGLQCSKCPESENHCLDFHHVRNKKFSINYMINNSYSTSRIEEEMEKCIVLCGNCHRFHHYGNTQLIGMNAPRKLRSTTGSNNNKGRKRLRIWVYKIKSQLSCYECNYSHPRVIEFHHILTKLYGINTMVHRALSRDRIVAEIRKCIPLCVNCHRKFHNGILDISISETQLDDYWAPNGNLL